MFCRQTRLYIYLISNSKLLPLFINNSPAYLDAEEKKRHREINNLKYFLNFSNL